MALTRPRAHQLSGDIVTGLTYNKVTEDSGIIEVAVGRF